jgi:hypothetical protein
MRTIKTYSKGAPFYNAFTRTLHLILLSCGAWSPQLNEEK